VIGLLNSCPLTAPRPPLSQPFGQVCDLLALTEELQKFSAVCHGCSEDAAFSQRLTADTAVELIGGSEMYVPMCRPCFLRNPRATGSIHITMGPMFSGKSSDLLRRVRRMQHAKKKCLLVKFHKDDRYSEVRLCVYVCLCRLVSACVDVCIETGRSLSLSIVAPALHHTGLCGNARYANAGGHTL
jgi:hypothetical protein